MITKKIKTIGIGLLVCLSSISTQAQQIKSLGDFTGIKVDGTFNITVSQSDANTIQVEGDEKNASPIKTEIKDGVLIITSDGTVPIDKLIKIGVKSLKSISASGTGDIKTDNQLICDKLSIESSGTGDITVDVKATEISTQTSGAGDIELKGTAQILIATVSGAGDLKASNLLTDKAKVKVSGVGNGKVNVKQSLDADISGAGSVIYKGNPAERNINITGVGSVRESKSGNGEETASDTTKFKFGKKKYVIIDDGKEEDEDGVNQNGSLRNPNRDFKHWGGLEIGVNGLLDSKNSLSLPAGANFLDLNYSKSLQFGLNLFEKDFHIYKNYVNLVTGFGFDFNHYALKNDVTLNSSSKYQSASTDSTHYGKNTLNVSYIKIPLMLEFNTSSNSRNDLHIAAGVEFEYRIHSVTKQKFEENDQHIKIKQRDDFNLAPFLYNFTTRVGYNNVTLFANYSLNGLFTKNAGPAVYPFTLGVEVRI
jgi:hypothetical protein